MTLGAQQKHISKRRAGFTCLSLVLIIIINNKTDTGQKGPKTKATADQKEHAQASL